MEVPEEVVVDNSQAVLYILSQVQVHLVKVLMVGKV